MLTRLQSLVLPNTWKWLEAPAAFAFHAGSSMVPRELLDPCSIPGAQRSSEETPDFVPDWRQKIVVTYITRTAIQCPVPM